MTCIQFFELKYRNFLPNTNIIHLGVSKGIQITGSTYSICLHKCNEFDGATGVDEGVVMKQM